MNQCIVCERKLIESFLSSDKKKEVKEDTHFKK
jgi:hypothetical protein